jgi:hypothetical protein
VRGIEVKSGGQRLPEVLKLTIDLAAEPEQMRDNLERGAESAHRRESVSRAKQAGDERFLGGINDLLVKGSARPEDGLERYRKRQPFSSSEAVGLKHG